jgi:hypothetical protein
VAPLANHKQDYGTVWMVGVNIYPKENDLPIPFAPTNICPLGCYGTVWMLGVNIYPKENDLLLLFGPTNICPLGCLDGGVNVDVDERGRAGSTTNLLQFATF